MTRYKDWFAVNVEKRASMVRSRPMARILKELLANSLDAGATAVTIKCNPSEGTKRDKAGLRAYDFACEDNGGGCENPEILRTVGSSTSDLHPRTRGRFGQGLIDVVAACERAEIRTLRHRLRFNGTGCEVSTVRGDPIRGSVVEGILRHDGDGNEELADYFRSVILPANIRLTFNGGEIEHRQAMRTIEGLKLLTVSYKPEETRWARFSRITAVEVLPQWSDNPMIYELGIPVDRMPWSLPFNVNVLQKTPLDVERDMLPKTYKRSLLLQLVAHLSDDYQQYVQERGVPEEIAGGADLAGRLSDAAKEAVIRETTGSDPKMVVRRNPFDHDDRSESAELEELHGYTSVNLGHLASGVASLLKDTPTVAKTHDEQCKPNFRHGRLPAETLRQKQCLEMYAALAGAILKGPVRCQRCRGGNVAAAFGKGVISLSINVADLWDDPLGEESVGIILHECRARQGVGTLRRVSGRNRPARGTPCRLGCRKPCVVATVA